MVLDTARKTLLILVLCWLAACQQEPTFSPLGAGTTVLAFGDSVTHGTGAAAREDYPSLLAGQTGWQVINAGIPGDTAHSAKARIGALIERHRPALVLVELGGNDFLRRRAASAVQDDLRAILTAAIDSGAITVLIAVPEASAFRAKIGALSDSPIYAELAEELSIVLVEEVLADVLSDGQLRADPIHPNAEGYRQFTQGVLAHLARVGLVR